MDSILRNRREIWLVSIQVIITPEYVRLFMMVTTDLADDILVSFPVSAAVETVRSVESVTFHCKKKRKGNFVASIISRLKATNDGSVLLQHGQLLLLYLIMFLWALSTKASTK